MKLKRYAFTMLELVFVIVVMGILAALAIPRMQRDLRQEAADNLISAIRYTQHLALMDDKTDPNKSKWQQRYWHIYFGTCGGKKFYAIGSDQSADSSNNGRVDFSESAIDPANQKHIWAHDSGSSGSCEGSHSLSDISPNVFIGKKYSIDTVSVACGGGGTATYIGFDHLGRPHRGFGTANLSASWNAPMPNDCTYTFGFEDSGISDLKITIQKETGFAQVVGQNGS